MDETKPLLRAALATQVRAGALKAKAGALPEPEWDDVFGMLGVAPNVGRDERGAVEHNSNERLAMGVLKLSIGDLIATWRPDYIGKMKQLLKLERGSVDAGEIHSWWFADSFVDIEPISHGSKPPLPWHDGVLPYWNNPPTLLAVTKESDGVCSLRGVCETLRLDHLRVRSLMRTWMVNNPCVPVAAHKPRTNEALRRKAIAHLMKKGLSKATAKLIVRGKPVPRYTRSVRRVNKARRNEGYLHYGVEPAVGHQSNITGAWASERRARQHFGLPTYNEARKVAQRCPAVAPQSVLCAEIGMVMIAIVTMRKSATKRRVSRVLKLITNRSTRNDHDDILVQPWTVTS